MWKLFGESLPRVAAAAWCPASVSARQPGQAGGSRVHHSAPESHAMISGRTRTQKRGRRGGASVCECVGHRGRARCTHRPLHCPGSHRVTPLLRQLQRPRPGALCRPGAPGAGACHVLGTPDSERAGHLSHEKKQRRRKQENSAKALPSAAAHARIGASRIASAARHSSEKTRLLFSTALALLLGAAHAPLPPDTALADAQQFQQPEQTVECDFVRARRAKI